MIVATRVNLDRLARWAWALWGGLLGSLAVVFVVGTAVKGSNRWIDIGPFNLQPSEIGKVVMGSCWRAWRSSGCRTSAAPRFTLFLAGVVGDPHGRRLPAARPRHRAGLRGHPAGDPLPGGRALDALRRVRVDPGDRDPRACSGSCRTRASTVLQPYQVERLTAFIGAERDTQRRRLPARPEQDGHRLGRRAGQGPRRRHPGERRLPARAPHRLHLRRHLRDVRLRRRRGC